MAKDLSRPHHPTPPGLSFSWSSPEARGVLGFAGSGYRRVALSLKLPSSKAEGSGHRQACGELSGPGLGSLLPSRPGLPGLPGPEQRSR